MGNQVAILAIGDVHLGTRCSGVADVVSSWGIDLNELTPAAALKLTADFAIEQEVDAVLFAGDVVESTNARFEAIPPLEGCVRRLVGAGIDVIAVAGNHDVEALPRMASLVDGFTLLGAGGRWESRTITKNKVPVVEIVGWSFGERFSCARVRWRNFYPSRWKPSRRPFPVSACFMRISTLPGGITHPSGEWNSTIPVTTLGFSVIFTSLR